MILSDRKVLELMEAKKLIVEPLVENAIQPASIDCALGEDYLVVDENHMDIITLNSEIKYRSIKAKEITLPPHSFILATTQETIELPDDFPGRPAKTLLENRI